MFESLEDLMRAKQKLSVGIVAGVLGPEVYINRKVKEALDKYKKQKAKYGNRRSNPIL